MSGKNRVMRNNDLCTRNIIMWMSGVYLDVTRRAFAHNMCFRQTGHDLSTFGFNTLVTNGYNCFNSLGPLVYFAFQAQQKN